MDLSELERLEQAARVVDQRMKLSEAIRLGARIRPQCTSGAFFEDGASCAFGAAYEAITGYTLPNGSRNGMEISLVIPEYRGNLSLADQIIERNDAGYTREQLADWLEGQGY